MTHYRVSPVTRKHARRMRRAMTEPEAKLWNEIRAHRLMGLSFRRQMPIAGCIADFACPSHKLIIEIDGSQHAEPENRERDRKRQANLEQLGWTIIRFWNDDILHSLHDVCSHIVAVAQAMELDPNPPELRP